MSDLIRGGIYANKQGKHLKIIGIQTFLGNKGPEEVVCLQVDEKGIPFSHKKKYFADDIFRQRYSLVG